MNIPVAAAYLCVALMTLSVAPGAWATLGERADSIANDSHALSVAARTTITRAKYSLQELKSETTTVREYLTPEGVVFAVAWNGLVHPDLSVLLGCYDEEYRSALAEQQRVPGRRQKQVRSQRLIVETWGHMRNLQGRAYLPELVPEGVNLYEIR